MFMLLFSILRVQVTCFPLDGPSGHCPEQGPGNLCQWSAPEKPLEEVSFATVPLASAQKAGSPPSIRVTALKRRCFLTSGLL